MVRMSVLNDALKNITNAERRGKRQVRRTLTLARDFCGESAKEDH